MSISKRVRELFFFYKEKSILQKEFCDTTGFKEKNLSNVIVGNIKMPRADLIAAIAKYDRKVNIYWVLLGEGNMFLSEKEQEINDLELKSEDVPEAIEKMMEMIKKMKLDIEALKTKK